MDQQQIVDQAKQSSLPNSSTMQSSSSSTDDHTNLKLRLGNESRFLRSYVRESSKANRSSFVREILKEGIVNYISIDSSTFETKQKWEKCRLMLVKSAETTSLEFYSPLKSSPTKPKCGLFCFLINDARPTNSLEMPDHEFTFVLKTSNLMEYIIETQSHNDMIDWLRLIRNYIPYDGQSKLNEGDKDEDAIDGQIFASIKNYSWFHRTLSRSLAAQLVLKEGTNYV